MKLDESLKQISEIWHKECLKLTKSLSEIEVIEKLANLKMPISQDVIQVYSTLGGMEDCESDATCFSFWGINKIVEENKPNSELVSFADFLIGSHYYCFKFENKFVSSIYIWEDTEKIADSFKEFFENYLTNPEKYYLFEREENKKVKKTRIQTLRTFLSKSNRI